MGSGQFVSHVTSVLYEERDNHTIIRGLFGLDAADYLTSNHRIWTEQELKNLTLSGPIANILTYIFKNFS
jgi:hypothetical protein